MPLELEKIKKVSRLASIMRKNKIMLRNWFWFRNYFTMYIQKITKLSIQYKSDFFLHFSYCSRKNISISLLIFSSRRKYHVTSFIHDSYNFSHIRRKNSYSGSLDYIRWKFSRHNKNIPIIALTLYIYQRLSKCSSMLLM